jgi:PiT family inorganic phosphate transporter
MTYALNRAVTPEQTAQFVALAKATQDSLQRQYSGEAIDDARATLTTFVRTRDADPAVLPALAAHIGTMGRLVGNYGDFSKVPSPMMSNLRGDMFLASETIRHLEKANNIPLADADRKNLTAFKKEIDNATKFIPLWVKVSVAIALGLGTMVGWKRIVVTVGEKIGKTHLSYGQGAAAELVAMTTIGAADAFGLPVSTTHVLSSGVAGTMAANRSGLQMGTIRNLAVAWVLTLPASIALSGALFWLFSQFL